MRIDMVGETVHRRIGVGFDIYIILHRGLVLILPFPALFSPRMSVSLY